MSVGEKLKQTYNTQSHSQHPPPSIPSSQSQPSFQPSLEQCFTSAGISVDSELLDQTITNPQHVADISKKLTKWQDLAPYLHIQDEEEEEIKALGSLSEQKREVLKVWVRKLGSEATYRRLCTVLWEQKRLDLVDTVCEVLKCSRFSCSFHAYPHQLPITPLQSQSPISRYANYLKAVYKRSEFPEYSNPACYKWMPYPGEKFRFINLTIISKKKLSNEEAERLKKKAIHGHIDLILKEKAPIALENILQVEQGQSLPCVLIEGAPGIGKSTLAWEICHRWGKGELFREYSIVLLVTLRDERVQRATCVVDLFYHSDKKLQEEVVQEINTINGKGVLILLEGLDELPRHLLTGCSIFTDLLSGAIFPEATVLVTSRPSATDKLWQRWWQKKSRHIEILGFTNDKIIEYMISVLSEDQISGFCNYLSINTYIKSMMYVPLHCAIAIAVYLQCQQSDKAPPKTLSGLYTCLAQIILTQYLKDHPDYNGRECKFDSFSELPSPVYSHFKKLCHLAFDGVSDQQLVFHNIPQSLDSSHYEHLGFMNAVPERFSHLQLSASYSYNFLHLSVQEYLAAYHVSLMSHSEQEQLLQTVKYGDHRFNMVRFLAGITQLKHLNKKLVKKVIGIKIKGRDWRHEEITLSDYTLEFLYECQDVSILDGKSCHITIHSTDSVHRLMALGYCIAISRSKWNVRFSDRDTSGAEVLCHSLKENPHSTYSIETFECSNCTPDFTHQVLQHLPVYALKQTIQVVIQQVNFQLLPPCLPELIPRIDRLNTLTLKNVLDTSLTELIPVLSRVPTLRNLTLHKLNSEGITLLCLWLPTCQLETLTLIELIKTRECCRMRMIFCNNSIEIMECQQNTEEFLDQIISQIPKQTIAHTKTLAIKYEMVGDHFQPQPLPPCLPKVILRMERLNTLTLENVLDTSLTDLMPTLSRVLNLRIQSDSGNFEMLFPTDSLPSTVTINACTPKLIGMFLPQLPHQTIAHIESLTITYSNAQEDPQPLPPCLPKLIPKMEKLNTLTLENVLDTSLTELISVLSRVPTLRNLTLHKLNSESITLLCQWLPTCQLETLTLIEIKIRECHQMKMTFCNNSIEIIECQQNTEEFLDQILSQIPKQTIAHTKSLTIKYEMVGDHFQPQPLAPCLPKVILRMKRLNTLTLENVLDTSLTDLMPTLSRVPTLRNLWIQSDSGNFEMLFPTDSLSSTVTINASCIQKLVGMILPQLPQQTMAHIGSLTMTYSNAQEDPQTLPPCLPELIPKMEKLNTLVLNSVLDTLLTVLIPVLSRVPTLRNLTLHKLNSKDITLLCQWLPTCQLETLTLYESYNNETIWCRRSKQVKFCSNSIEAIDCTTEFIDQILSQIPQQSLEHIKTLTICSKYKNDDEDRHCTLLTLPPCLPELISRMEGLHTLLLKNVLDTSVTKLILVLSRVPTLRNLTLHKLNSEGIALFCKWLSTCQLETLTLYESLANCQRPKQVKFCSNSIEAIDCTTEFIDQILPQIPQQSLEHINTLTICSKYDKDSHCTLLTLSCLPELIPRMEGLHTLLLKNVLDTSVTKLISVLSRVPTLRNLTLHKLNSEGITLLCQWLPTCQLQILTLHEQIEGYRYIIFNERHKTTVTITFCNNSIEAIECRNCTKQFINQVLSQISQHSTACVQTLTLCGNIHHYQPLPPCLPELIPRMKKLNTLTIENVLDISLKDLILVLSRVPTLRNLTLHELNSECITLLCQWLPTCQLETLTLPSLSMYMLFCNNSIEAIECQYHTTDLTDQILLQIPQQSMENIKILTIEYEIEDEDESENSYSDSGCLYEEKDSYCTLPPLSRCLPEVIPRMERLNTLILENVLDSSLTKLIPALPRVPTLRNLILPALNSKGITLLCQWLPTCQLEILRIRKEVLQKYDAMQQDMTAIFRFSNTFIESIVFEHHTLEIIDHYLSQIPQQSITHVKRLTIRYEYDYSQSIPSCLPDLIPRMERLNTLKLESVLDTSLTKLIPVLPRIPTLRNLEILSDSGDLQIQFCKGSFLSTISGTPKLIGMFLTQLPRKTIAQTTSIILYSQKGPQPLPPCLPQLIPRMKLEMLELSSLSPDDIEKMSRSLTTVSSLNTLDIHWSKFTLQSMQNFVSMLQKNQSLTELDITGCSIDSDNVCCLAEALYYGITLKKLYMSENPVGERGALAIAKMLQHNTTLEEFDLSSIEISSDGTIAMAEALHHNTTLRKLYMSENPVGERGALAMAEIFKHNTTLEEIDLSSIEISSDGTIAMAEVLHHNTTLRKLHMNENPVGEEGACAMAEMLKHNTILEELYLSHSEISSDGTVAMAEALHLNTTLRKLEMSDNSVGERGVLAMAEMLKHNTTLEELYLINAKINASGTVAMAEALHHNTALRKLGMSENLVGERGALAMAEMLKHNTTLKELYLTNAKINTSGAIAMTEALHHNTALRKLDMSQNRVGERGACAMAEMLKHNTILEELYLSHSEISSDGTVAMAEALHLNTTLRKLGMSDNSVGKRGASAMAEMLKHNTTLEEWDFRRYWHRNWW